MNWYAYLTLWALSLGGTCAALIGDPLARSLSLLLLGALYLGVLLLGMGRPELGLYARLLRRGSAAEGSVALTFESGLDPERFPRLLARLKEENVPAAFFCTGRSGEARPQLLRRAETEGHLIASRAYDPHGVRGVWSNRAVHGQLERGAAALAAVLKRRPRLVRLPTGFARPGVEAMLQRLDLIGIAWDVTGRERDLRTPERISAWVAQRARNGSVIALAAEAPDGGSAETTASQVIARLRERGFTFVRLDRLLDLTGYDET